jgi:hypothetical protein
VGFRVVRGGDIRWQVIQEDQSLSQALSDWAGLDTNKDSIREQYPAGVYRHGAASVHAFQPLGCSAILHDIKGIVIHQAK